jgi:hypothetical protein
MLVEAAWLVDTAAAVANIARLNAFNFIIV